MRQELAKSNQAFENLQSDFKSCQTELSKLKEQISLKIQEYERLKRECNDQTSDQVERLSKVVTATESDLKTSRA